MDDPKSASELIVKLSRESIPKKFGVDSINDIQVLSPMQKGDLGARNLNLLLQKALNSEGIQIERFGVTYRVGDRVMQTENDYDKDVYNGDLGYIERIDHQSGEVFVKFEERSIVYDAKELDSLLHAYSITIHKSQGSEYPVVIIPIHNQHYVMLQRTLIYTALTRAKKLAILVGTKKALNLCISQTLSHNRTTLLKEHLTSNQ